MSEVEVPKTAKKPTDRKPKKAAKAEAEVESIVVEYNDLTYTIDPDIVNDVETFEMIGNMQMASDNEASFYMPAIVRRIVGDEQWSQFLNGNRNSKGRVPLAALDEFFDELNRSMGNRQASHG